MGKRKRRGRDSNPRYGNRTLVFETSSFSRSDTSPTVRGPQPTHDPYGTRFVYIPPAELYVKPLYEDFWAKRPLALRRGPPGQGVVQTGGQSMRVL